MSRHTQWQDLFVLIDDGLVTIEQYRRLEPLVRQQAARYPNGVGCLVILPAAAKAPPALVRRHLEAMLQRLPVRALCYLVEGQGFRAAAVRAVLISLGIFKNPGYSTLVSTSLYDAVGHLLAPASTGLDVRAAVTAVRRARATS